MEFIEGESMAQMIGRTDIKGILDWLQAWQAATHITRALDESFRENIIHCNVTAANNLRRSSDKVFLLDDLVLAKALESTLSKQITQVRQFINDVPSMSPERTRDSETTGQCSYS